MQIRTRTRFPFLVSLAALTTVGCGVNQSSRFQNSFLPAAPPAVTSASSDLPSPPEIKTSIVPRETPAFLAAHPQLPAKQTRGDEMVLQAEEYPLTKLRKVGGSGESGGNWWKLPPRAHFPPLPTLRGFVTHACA